ncbi:Log1p CYBJADRAFT_166645 [Cyberlindnera jadinii NRRL Y-1542]|uniref:Uncharacterized protein n=1 Tax=Cyberlindnera jadinii (strain ATCC 18201 / CBS 1600 / BCRC 20928 / JCM 3617 / NBRC 0987 / NRRL Y-1542) TaxID=983966 RepID=A0A1E4S5S2_CYBJN|nr:hypothetical protein CYBJADRAFT_166645 [Cyberlindnera jadinii NRRL Y-1542]ODV74858.1 hypothetical protein CYBJADRAFT_166645 [Cyberlindnera jadinii NRRL Y-1542]
MTTSEKVVCVFCGSSFGNDPEFTAQAKALGQELASKKWGLVYGGGTTGLMGAVAKGCSSNKGYVHGIIPDALVSKERADEDVEAFNNKLKESVDNHQGVTPINEEYGKTTVVPDMHTRKRMMGLEADAFIAMPGGYGTLEEVMEVITWSQLGIHSKPIVFFNINGFYDGLLEFIKSSIKSEFISEKNGNIIKVGTTVDEVLSLIENYEVPEGRYNLKWESLGKSSHQ